MRNKDLIVAACPPIEGARIDDLLEFLRTNNFDVYIPEKT